MPATPRRRYLIDVPGGEEEGTGWGFEFDINTVLNVMNRTIRTGKTSPYNALVHQLQQHDPLHGGGMGYLKYMEHPHVLLWMYSVEDWDLTRPRLQSKFMHLPEEAFCEPGKRYAQEWLAAHINSSIVGPGAFGKLGYLVSASELSDFIMDPRNYAVATIQARGGVVAIINKNLKAAKYIVVPACGRNFLPIWSEGIDIGKNSVGSLSKSREWFWNVKPLTPYEQTMINELFAGG
jgi:hypothetical protein